VELIIVRHGRPVRIEGADGIADPELAPVGLKQAEAVASYLEGLPIDLIVSSPLARARQTAAPLAKRLNLETILVPDLAEIDRDSDTYLPMEEVKASGGDDWQAIVDDPDSMHGDVDIPAFSQRVHAAFEKLVAENPGQTVVAFCHAMVTMCYLQQMLGYEDKYGIRIDYAGITRIQASRNGARSIRAANETMHLGDHFILSP
jgi:probable phosphoglycerate mutase